MNLSTQISELERFRRDPSVLKEFLNRRQLDGVELMQYEPWKEAAIPAGLVKGLHMSFWPFWLDFWKMDIPELKRQFGGDWSYAEHYGGDSPEIMLETYRKDIATAVETGAEYLVFHVSHVRPRDCYTYDFAYGSKEVAEASIELLNEVMDGVRADFRLLFENLWWPGLTLIDREIAQMLLDKVRYPKKGFMLDTGHLMNNNRDLESEAQAVEYIMKTLHDLGELSSHIVGVHLNSSLSGSYVKSAIQAHRSDRTLWKNDFEGHAQLCRHVAEVDRHRPFIDAAVRKVIQYINPAYLVYELRADSLEELEADMILQDRALGLSPL